MKQQKRPYFRRSLAFGLLSLFAAVAHLGAQDLPSLFTAPWRGFDTAAFPDGFAPKSIAAGDLDSDGDADVVVGNWFFGGSGISVLRNRGDGTFAEPVRYAAIYNRNVEHVALADIDGDGDLDVLATITNISGAQNLVSLWRNGGTGTFGIREDFTAGPRPSDLVVADFDGDHFPDVVTTSYSGNSISFLRHNGQSGNAAGLLPAVQTPAVKNAERLVVGDLNGDGKLDLVVGGFDELPPPGSPFVTYPTGIQAILLGDGHGNFTKTGEYLPTPPPNRAGGNAVALLDIDRDGDLDLIGCGAGQSANGSLDYGIVALRLNNGDGTFGVLTQYQLADFVWVPSHFTVADLNRDSYPDLIAATPSGRSGDGYNVLLNNKAGGFLPATFYCASQQTFATAATDADGDGDLDVLTVAQSSSAVTVHRNPGDALFVSPLLYPVGGYTEAEEVADLDHDGDLDIVTNDDAVRILKNNGNGTFAAAATFTPPRNFADMKLRDLNGDGFADLLLGPDAEYPPYHFATALNRGDGTFAPGVIRQVGSCGEGSIDAVDLDNDGDLDVILTEEQGCAGGAQPRLFVFRNDGPQQFFGLPPLIPPGFANGIAGGDVNRDGKMDMITSVGQGMAVYLGHGDLTFDAPIISSTRAYKFQVGDLNGDGKLDVAMLVPQPSFGTVYAATALGNGDGTFQEVRQQSGSSVFESAFRISGDIDLGDADGDGRLDVLVTNNASNDVSIFLSAGDGSLRPHQRYGVGYSPLFSSFGDFDRDGVADVATVVLRPPSGFANDVVVLRGLGGVRGGIPQISASGGTFTLKINSLQGRIYQLQRMSAGGAFADLGAPQNGNDAQLIFTDPMIASSGIYRVTSRPVSGLARSEEAGRNASARPRPTTE